MDLSQGTIPQERPQFLRWGDHHLIHGSTVIDLTTGDTLIPVATDNGNGASGELVIDLPDPTVESERRRLRVDNPYDVDGLCNLCATTTARIGIGRAGARPKTASLLLFQADHAVTQIIFIIP